MLCISRKPGQSLSLFHKGEEIKIEILGIRHKTEGVRIGIRAAREVDVVREELLDAYHGGHWRETTRKD